MAMRRTDRSKWSELKVGILVMFGLFFLLWASFSGGGTSIFYAKHDLYTTLSTSNGLVEGAPVRLSGVEVGKVSSITLVGESQTDQVRIHMRVEERVWSNIKSDSRATLGTIGMLGDKYIEVTPGSTDLPDLEPGASIPGHVAGDLLTIIDKAPEMIGNLQRLSTALGNLATRLESSKGTIGKLLYSDSLYNSLLAMSTETSKLIADVKRDLPSLTDRAHSTLDKIDDLAASAKDTSGSLGMILTSRDLYDRLDRVSAGLDSLVADVKAGKGTAGAMLKDEQLYSDFHKTLLDLQFLLKDIHDNPKKYVNFSIF